MGNMRDPTLTSVRRKPAKRPASAQATTIAERLQGFVGACTTTDAPPDTSERYKEKLRVAFGKKRSH